MVLQAEDFLPCIHMTTDSDNCIWLVGAQQVVLGRRNHANDDQSNALWDRDDRCGHDYDRVGPLLYIRLMVDGDNDLYLVGEQQVFHGLRNHVIDDDNSTLWVRDYRCGRGQDRVSRRGKCGV